VWMEPIFELLTFYAQILMYLTIHLCSYICFIDVLQLLENKEDISKRVVVRINCV
jgi:hypothetical protein